MLRRLNLVSDQRASTVLAMIPATDVIVMKIVGRSEAEIGWYGAAYKPLDVITVIPIIFMGLVLPLFVHAWSTMDHDRVRRIIQRAVDAVGILAWHGLSTKPHGTFVKLRLVIVNIDSINIYI